MSTHKVAVIVGSLRKESTNRKLAKALEKLAGAKLDFRPIEIGGLPLYTQEFDGDYPAACRQLKEQVEAADAVLFVTPEYNRSIPGVLKNAIDIGSRPWGTNSFKGKPAAVIGTSPGAVGTAMAQQHLRNVLSYLDMVTLPQPEAYIQFKEGLVDEAGDIANEGTRKFLQDFVDTFAAWVQKHS